MHGRPYEALMRSHYPYAAVLEFDDLAGLKAYLEHPAHERLGSRFFEVFEDALMYDFDMQEGASGLARCVGQPALDRFQLPPSPQRHGDSDPSEAVTCMTTVEPQTAAGTAKKNSSTMS